MKAAAVAGNQTGPATRKTGRKHLIPRLAYVLFKRAFGSGRSLSHEEGSTMVEFAMVTVLLVTIIFGVMGIGFALYCYGVVSEAAREGTRYAIVRGSACTSFASACPAATNGSDVKAYVKSLAFPGIDPSQIGVTSTYSATTSGATCSPSAACNDPGNQIQVTVTYKLPLVIPFVPTQTLNMSSTSQMVISQ